jgi:hypothetical protein
MIKATEIGQELYPLDNSWLENITNPGWHEYLAGVRGELAKRVKVVSLPFVHNVNFSNEEYRKEFVNVEFEGQVFRVLNKFHDSEDDMVREKNLQSMWPF